jgi:hypothetical protein
MSEPNPLWEAKTALFCVWLGSLEKYQLTKPMSTNRVNTIVFGNLPKGYFVKRRNFLF